MKRLLIAGLALALLVPACALAQSAFNGTWKTDVNSIKSGGEPLILNLKNGIYECNCVPPVKVKADGQDHAVTGHPGFDTVAIKVLNDHSIQQTDKKDGKVVFTRTFAAAADGKTGTFEFTNTQHASPVTGKGIMQRVANGAPGSNAVAGSWQLKQVDNVSDNGLTSTYKVDGDTVSYSDPGGGSYTAKIGGKPVAYTSGAGIAGITVSVRHEGKDGLRETWYRDGKETSWDTMTVAADGKTMKTVSRDLREHTHESSTATKQ